MVLLDRDVNGNPLFQVNNILLKSFNFNFSILQLFKKFEGSFIGFVDFLFKFKDIVSCVLKLFLEFISGSVIIFFSLLSFLKLFLDILLVVKVFLKGENGAFKSKDGLFMSLNDDSKTINLGLIRSSLLVHFLSKRGNYFILFLT